MPTPINPLPLEYAVAQTLVGPDARKAFAQLLILSILSGLCVGVCFLAMMGEMFFAIVHVVVFAITIITAMLAGVVLNRLAPSTSETPYGSWLPLDLIALLGLAMIAVAPLVYHYAEAHSVGRVTSFGAFGLGLAYALLASTTMRHVILYRFLASACREINHERMARGLIALGWVKAVYEGLWLSSCAATLFLIAFSQGVNSGNEIEGLAVTCAFAAFFGTIGFAPIWVWMIVAHARLLNLAKG